MKEEAVVKIKYFLWSIPRKSLISFIVLLVVLLTITAVWADNKLGRNVELTKKAWEALDTEKYENAIKYATQCIREFGDEAYKEQNDLEKAKGPEPPEGKASKNLSKAEQDKIHERGLLNDVATCWYIKGRALEGLGKKEEAKAAYMEAEKFTYARTYDKSFNGFWSPAKKAASLRKSLN